MSTNNIIRTRPASYGHPAGIAVPGFIRNLNYYFTEIEVYADGVFACWGAVDLDFLAKKLKSGWISPEIPSGAKFGIHDLIQGKVVSGIWTHNHSSYHERLLDELRHLNPSMEGLVDFEGDDCELRDGVRYAKLGLTRGSPQRQRQPYESHLPSASRYALVRHNGQVFLTVIRVYADGGIDVHPLYGQQQVIDMDELKAMLAADEVALTVPDGTSIEIDSLGRFEVTNIWSYVDQSDDFVKEISDLIGGLNGEPESVAKCREAYQTYLDEPTVRNRERLKQAYESVPAHHRMYVGDMDVKDIPVRMIIYGDDEIEGWSHRIVARAQGDEELPSIEVPKPIADDEETSA